MASFRLRPVLAPGLLLLAGPISAQMQLGENVKLIADFALRYQFYKFNTTAAGFGRFPTHLPRFDADGEFKVGNELSIPFALRIGRTLPSPLIINPPTPQSLGQYLLHPGTMIYAGPKWKNLQLHLGSQSPYFSELSIGDLQLFGLGATYQMGTYKLFGVIGIGQRSIEPTGPLSGAFRRDVMALRIERNLNKKHVVGVNIVQAKDRLNSIGTTLPTLLPQKGVILSVNGNFKLSKELTVNGEVANAAFAPDTRVDSLNSEFSPAGLLISSTHTSSFAMTAGLRYAKKGNGFSAHVKRIGKEFNHVAYPQRDNDVLDVKFSPYGQLLKSKVNVSAQFGLLSNSVSQLDSSLFGNQLFGAVTSSIRPMKAMDLQLNYFRSHVNSDSPVDSLKYTAVVQNLQVAPTLKKKLFGLNHRITLLVSMNSTATSKSPFFFAPTSILSNYQLSYSTDVKQVALTASYAIAPRKVAFSPDSVPAPTTRTNTLTLAARGRFKENQLQPALTLSFAGTKFMAVTPPTKVVSKVYVRASCQYRFTEKTSGQIVIINDRNSFPAASGSKNELFFQLELKHRL